LAIAWRGKKSDNCEGRIHEMGFGLSLLLVTAGAILAWAVNVEARGVDLDLIGVILLVIGAIGLALSVVFWTTWGGFGTRRERYVERDVVADPPVERYREERVSRY
jgi:Domain of unknown function (DUF6458)